MGEFAEGCEKEFYVPPMKRGEEGQLHTRVQKIAALAQRLTLYADHQPAEEQVRNIVTHVGTPWTSRHGEAHFDLWALSQNVGWCFSRDKGYFPDLSEQPILAAIGLEGKDVRTIVDYGLTRFANVDVGMVASQLSGQFAEDSLSDMTPYPFFVERLSDVLPDPIVRSQFIVRCLDQTFSEYRHNPVESEQWRLRKGQALAGLLLNKPHELQPYVLSRVLKEAAAYGCPGLAHAIKVISSDSELLPHSGIPELSPAAAQDAAERYKSEYGKWKKYPVEDAIRLLWYVPKEDQLPLLKELAPDVGMASQTELLLLYSEQRVEDVYRLMLQHPPDPGGTSTPDRLAPFEPILQQQELRSLGLEVASKVYPLGDHYRRWDILEILTAVDAIQAGEALGENAKVSLRMIGIEEPTLGGLQEFLARADK